jgi:hypothetical protein
MRETQCMECRGVRFTRHAFERLFERGIPPDSVMRIMREGEVIASYPDDVPFPSALILGHEAGKAVHVVVARDPDTGLCHVVTVYRPNPAIWSDDFKTRRQP